MGKHDEYSWRLKITRARRQIEQLAGEVDSYLAESGASFRHDYDRDAHQIAAVLQADFLPPRSIGVTVGDVLHNLRSALDNITWQIVTATNPAPKKPHLVLFPITSEPKKFEEALAKPRLPGVPKEAVDVFRWLQPWYWREEARRVLGDDKLNDGWSAASEPLGRLQRLSNDDKHKAIHPLALYSGLLSMGGPEGGGLTLHRGDPPPWGPGSVVVRWQLAADSTVDRYSPNGEVLIGLDIQDAAAPCGAPVTEANEDHAADQWRCELHRTHVLPWLVEQPFGGSGGMSRRVG